MTPCSMNAAPFVATNVPVILVLPFTLNVPVTAELVLTLNPLASVIEAVTVPSLILFNSRPVIPLAGIL